jgi:hypothetical protein
MKSGMNGTHQPQILTRPRSRRDAAKTLAVALQTRLRRQYEAGLGGDPDEIAVTTADLAQCMIENIEFVIWALKAQGGMNPPPPEELKKISKHHQTAIPKFEKPPEPVLQDNLPDECTCPPLEHGIIGRDKHMVSCPKFVP